MSTIKEQEQELLPLPAQQDRQEDSSQRSCAVIRNNTRALVERLEKKNFTVRSPPVKMTSPRRSFEYSMSPPTVEKTAEKANDGSLDKPKPPVATRAQAKAKWTPKVPKRDTDEASVFTTFSKELARKKQSLKKSLTGAPRSSFDSSKSELTEARNGLRPAATASRQKTNNNKF